jgi:hypothetical protein
MPTKNKHLRRKNLRTGLALTLVLLASIAMTVIWSLQYLSL